MRSPPVRRMPDSTSVEDCYQIAEKHEVGDAVAAFHVRALRATCVGGDAEVGRSGVLPFAVVASSFRIRAQSKRRRLRPSAPDLPCMWITPATTGNYERAAEYLLERLRQLRKQSGRVCLISGGEVTVKVINGGVGGRNQQFALACAVRIAGENITILSAGTDGVDGNSPAAGAVADGSTATRARAHGLDPCAALEKFDAYPFFCALGDAIEIGPTGNNLRDLRILLAY